MRKSHDEINDKTFKIRLYHLNIIDARSEHRHRIDDFVGLAIPMFVNSFIQKNLIKWQIKLS